MQGLPIATIRYYGDIAREVAPSQEGVLADAAIVSRLLDDLEYTASEAIMRDDIARLADAPSTSQQADSKRRQRLAIAYLRRAGWVRGILLPDGVGWVWVERDGSDEEWLERYARRAQTPRPDLVIRVAPPGGGCGGHR